MKLVISIFSLWILLSLLSCGNNSQSGNTDDDSTGGSADTTGISLELFDNGQAIENIKRYDSFVRSSAFYDTARYKPGTMVMRLLSISESTIKKLLSGNTGKRIRFCIAMDTSLKLRMYAQVRFGSKFSYYDISKLLEEGPQTKAYKDDDLCPQPPLCDTEIER